VKVGVIVFPGSNCDRDCFYVVKEVLKEEVSYVWHQEDALDEFDCLILPGGFSYGDYLRAGAIARFSKVLNSVKKFADKGKIVIGICNGFQVLLESGLLPGAMLRNKNTHFICRYVYVRVESNRSPFTNLCREGQVLKIPIAHNEGNYYIENSRLSELKSNKQVVFRYCDKEGKVSLDSNPNGALYNIAGISNREGNILGMMPHPERCSESILGSQDGLLIFKSVVKWIQNNKGDKTPKIQIL